MFSLETFAVCGEDFVLKCCVEFAVQFRIFLHQLWWAGLSCTVVKAVKTLWSVWTVCELWSVKFVKHLEREQLFSFLSWVKWLSSNRLTEEVFQTDPPTLPHHPTFFLSFIFYYFLSSIGFGSVQLVILTPFLSVFILHQQPLLFLPSLTL